ncbi:uncharacterized protein EKO05_0001155 [Ascochyta rabiei]|uniref:uncharacterized protein n=1 Tax=Didymella rabiei TaxID=5454 RepID=UPI0019008690|nr:uncharacterized protein EKO05_0001155 [Ascochyta rabiei]UPX10497.1 hypothetical protein EKO05_0001155 [Ascochyta rabiei]
MSIFIDTNFIRALHPDRTRTELKALRGSASDEKISEVLLDAIERGSLSTSTFAAWLSVCRSPHVIEKSLRQKTSVHIRYLGVKQLKKGLGSAHWEELWDGLGGTSGLLDVIGDLSVLEVRATCKALGRSVKTRDTEHKRARLTELFEGLHPDSFPNAKHKTTDSRPLTKYYQALVPSCNEELVHRITVGDQKEKWKYVRERGLLEKHSSSIGTTLLQSIFRDQSPDTKSKERLQALSTRFPSTTTPEPGFSASMAFAFELLRELVETGSCCMDSTWVVDNLVRPLLRRGVRRHESWSGIQSITALIIRYLNSHPSAAKILTNVKGDVLHMVASCWSRRSALFEVHLKSLLKMVFGSTTRLEDFTNLLVGIPKSRRYPLLQLCCQEVMDINLNAAQNMENIRGKLTPGLLDSIGATHALGLFRRLRDARGDTDLVDLGQYSSVLVTTRTPDVYEGDPDIYYLVLLNRNGMHADAESHAASILKARKKITKTSSDRNLRAENALSVWACANASGSLRLLSETVNWARSFVRDQLTASKLFSTYYDETYKLLSGCLKHGDEVLNSKELRQRVECANLIMMDLLDIAFSALREPSFNSSNWRKTVGIFTHVIKERMRLSVDLEKIRNVPDEEVYYALWEDTITTLIRAETLANQEENEKLGANTISGIVVGKTAFTDIRPNDNGRATWKFLDNLARARNDLWKDLRPARYPDVLTLPEPFPRGLPVQHLLACWTPNTINLCELAPYIFSRVESTLFVSSKVALNPVSSEEHMQHAIGAFVDSYQYALNAYVSGVCDPQEKEKRLAKVWFYATGALSEQRMTSEEAIRYWKRHIPSYLQSTLSKVMPVEEHVPWPVVPEFDDPSEAHEWNPLEARPADVKIKARDLGTATYIDLCTIGSHAKHTKPHIWSHYEPPVPQVPAEESSVGSIWGCHSTDAEREASALAALLYLDAKYGSIERMLTTPFPSLDDVRYPCLYLDEDFLSRDELCVPDAAAYLSRHQGLIPLTLVHTLVTTLVGRFTYKRKSRVLGEAAFTLIRALSESDKPGPAFELAIEVIIGQPSASSWHRMLFYSGFLQRLPASDARACISKFARAVGKKLDAQNSRAQPEAAAGQMDNEIDKRAQSPDRSDAHASQTTIKVTTLKSLAQVLHGSTYIGDDFSLEILASLSKKVSHVDVRLSILRTLLSKLDANRPGLWDTVLSTLQSFIPLAGSLDEREHMTESDWTNAEKTMTMPKVQLTTKPTWREESPMLHAFVQRYLDLGGSKLTALYLRRIILPTLELLKRNTRRWALLFLRKYAPKHVEILQTMLPPVPLGIVIWEMILSGSSTKPYHIPKTILNEYVAYMSFRLNPPRAIYALNKGLEDDVAVKSRPEVAIWLELYGNGIDNVWLYRFSFTHISDFDDQESEDDEACITRHFYQKKWLGIFTTFLWADEPSYVQLRGFISTLTDPFNIPCPWWNQYGRTTVEAMLAYINGICTRDWQADPNRKPAILPDTFDWKLSLLSYPLTHLYKTNSEAREQACKQFSDELSAILDGISNSMYHAKFAQIQDRICSGRNLNNKDFKDNLMLSALYLGDISKTSLSWLTTPDLLRVNLAADMVVEVKGMDNGALEPRLKAMLDSWVSSENEEVRRTGYSAQNKYYNADGKKVELTRLRS